MVKNTADATRAQLKRTNARLKVIEGRLRVLESKVIASLVRINRHMLKLAGGESRRD